MIPFGSWFPDLPALENPGAIEALNVYPDLRSYRPWRELVPFVDALPSVCLGAISGSDPTGFFETFAGTANSLWKLNETVFEDVSQVGGYSVPSGDFWSMTDYNNGNLICAANVNARIQAWAQGTSTAFADLSATAPQARHIATVRDFLMAANLTDSGARPSRVRWSPIGDPSGDWTPSAQTQADFQDLASGGDIIGLAGGDWATILCRNSIHRATYVGSPLIFQFDEVSRDKGCVATGSIARIGQFVFFLAEDGFYVFDGQNLRPIGVHKVDDWFLRNVNSDSYFMINATADPSRKLYIVSFPFGAASPTNNHVLLYNWETQQWAHAEQTIEYIVRLFQNGYTLEQLNVFGGLEDVPASLDSRRWVGGALQMSAFNQQHRLSTIDGPPLAATIDTGEAMPHDPARAYVSGVRPLIDGATPTVALATRDLPGAALAWTSDTATNARTGMAPFKATNARYIRARVKTPAGALWEHAQGVDATTSPEGRQ